MDIPDEGDVHRDVQLPHRIRCLEGELRRLLPDLDFVTAYSWAGTFGETNDGLPVVGRVPEDDGVFYALGYGGNGISFSVIAADLLRDLCLGHDNPDHRIFRANR